MKAHGELPEVGAAWLRKPITDEERKEAGDRGWSILFVHLGEGRMLTVTDEGAFEIVHSDLGNYDWTLLDPMPSRAP